MIRLLLASLIFSFRLVYSNLVTSYPYKSNTGSPGSTTSSYCRCSMPFGQLVVGSPGSGKTTYCNGLHQFLTALKRPNVHIVNLDPANTHLPYPCSIDINTLISVHDVMLELSLGPNGAMLYCIEYLEENIEWLLQRLEGLGKEAYVVFDLPGQVELSTNHASLTRIVRALEKRADFRVSSSRRRG